MALDPVAINVIVGFVIGAVGGALSDYIGWNKSDEPFVAKKFIAGVITGVLTGISLVLSLVASIQSAVDQTALIIAYIGILLASVGVDNLRTGISASITKETQPTQ